MVRSITDKYEHDKKQLKEDYENLINQIRIEYQQQKNDLREHSRILE